LHLASFISIIFRFMASFDKLRMTISFLYYQVVMVSLSNHDLKYNFTGFYQHSHLLNMNQERFAILDLGQEMEKYL
jgi:hypothetical protein